MANSSQYGAFVPTNYIWDIQQLQETNLEPEIKELLVRMYQNIGLMALVLNIKTTGQFPLMETVNGNLWFPKPGLTSQTSRTPAYRQEITTTLNLPQNGGGFALPVGVTSINHNITVNSSTLFVGFNGMANDTIGFNYYQLGWASALGATNIEVKVNQTQVVITNNSGINFTDCFVVLRYLQN